MCSSSARAAAHLTATSALQVAERAAAPPASVSELGEGLRHEFPILDQEVNGKPLAYLDNAATSQKPLQVSANCGSGAQASRSLASMCSMNKCSSAMSRKFATLLYSLCHGAAHCAAVWHAAACVMPRKHSN